MVFVCLPWWVRVVSVLSVAGLLPLPKIPDSPVCQMPRFRLLLLSAFCCLAACPRVWCLSGEPTPNRCRTGSTPTHIPPIRPKHGAKVRRNFEWMSESVRKCPKVSEKVRKCPLRGSKGGPETVHDGLHHAWRERFLALAVAQVVQLLHKFPAAGNLVVEPARGGPVGNRVPLVALCQFAESVGLDGESGDCFGDLEFVVVYPCCPHFLPPDWPTFRSVPSNFGRGTGIPFRSNVHPKLEKAWVRWADACLLRSARAAV